MQMRDQLVALLREERSARSLGRHHFNLLQGGGRHVGIDHDQFVDHVLTPIGSRKDLRVVIERRYEKWVEVVLRHTEHTEGEKLGCQYIASREHRTLPRSSAIQVFLAS